MALPIASTFSAAEVDPHDLPDPESEAREALLGLAGRRFSPLPAELIVDHILRIYPYERAGFRMQRAALEAVLRRFRFAVRDDLRVAERPRAGLGAYKCKRGRRRSARPYDTALFSVSPLDASCDCPDFLRGGLGLCKHVLTVLTDLADRGRLEQVSRASPGSPRNGVGGSRDEYEAQARLTWDPVRPLTGFGDPLAGIRLVTRRRPGPRLTRHLTQAGVADAWVVKKAHLEKPERRRALLAELSAWTRRNPLAIDPAVKALLTEEQGRLARAASCKAAAGSLRRALKSMRRKLYPYQVAGVARFFERGRLLLADDMGLGKTAQAIGACHALMQTRRIRRGLIVMPASLRLQWEREWHSFTSVPVRVVDGGPEARSEIYRSTTRGFLITSYDHLMRDLAMILEWAPDLVVLDEAQRIKNWATKTAGSVKRIKSPYRLVLTGTPLENRLDELASIMDWVDDHALEPKWRLTPWHTSTADGGKEVVGACNLDTLRSRIAPVMIRRRRPEVISQLPPRTDTVIPVPITSEQAFEHDGYRQPILRLMSTAKKRPLTQAEFLRLMQLLTMQRIIANGLAQVDFETVWPTLRDVKRPDEALLTTLNTPKLLELRALIERVVVEQERKVIIFSQWRRMLTLASWALSPILDEAGLRAVFFTGMESQKRRMENVVDLHEDPGVRVLFASDAGGLGLNLQRAANCCVNLDLPWNPAVLEQRIGRIYRLGQNDPIDVYNLVSEGSIEERIAGIISDKMALFTGLFDGDSDEVSFDRSGSFLSQLEKLVEPPELAISDDDAEEDMLEDIGLCGLERDDMEGGDQARVDEAAAGDETRAAAVKEKEEGSGGGAVTVHEAGPIEEGGSEAQASDGETGPKPEAPTHSPIERGERETMGSPSEVTSLPDPAIVRRAFSGIAIRRTPTGGMRIDAEPEAAATLGALLEGLGRLMLEASEDRHRQG